MTDFTIHTEGTRCPLGCDSSDSFVLRGRDLLHGLPGEYSVVRCDRCDLMRTSPRPTPDTMSAYYPDDYGPYVGTRVSSSAQESWLKAVARLVVNRTIRFHTATLPRMRPGRMLEVGCASGAYLHYMANQGWHVEGIESSETAAAAASQLGYRVHVGPLETAPAPDGPLDLIVGWMVLEHLHDPVGGLRKLHEWSKPDGWLVLSVPNAGSFEFSAFRSRWYALQVPTHLYHFTPETLATVLNAGGWKIAATHHQRVLSNLIGSLGLLLRDKGFSRVGQFLVDRPERGRLIPYLFYPLAWLLSGFGQTGRMTVWAKPDK